MYKVLIIIVALDKVVRKDSIGLMIAANSEMKEVKKVCMFEQKT